jgi:hypothetical protein
LAEGINQSTEDVGEGTTEDLNDAFFKEITYMDGKQYF